MATAGSRVHQRTVHPHSGPLGRSEVEARRDGVSVARYVGGARIVRASVDRGDAEFASPPPADAVRAQARLAAERARAIRGDAKRTTARALWHEGGGTDA
jgi:hypothetical protein